MRRLTTQYQFFSSLLVIAKGNVMQRLSIALGQGIIARQLIQKAAAAPTSNATLGLRLVAALWLLLWLLHRLCTGTLAGSEVHGL